MSKISSLENAIKDMRVSHIYRIGEDYYYLGQMLCRKCTQEEVEVYHKLMNEYERLNSLEYDLEERDCKILKEYYSQMSIVEKDAYDDEKYQKARLERSELLDVEDAMLDNLIEQCNIYGIIMNWERGKLNRCFMPLRVNIS